MNKAKHEAQPVPESVLSMRPTGSASAEGDARSAGKGGLRAPRECCPRQWSISTEGKRWGWTQRTCLVILNRYRDAEESVGSGNDGSNFCGSRNRYNSY